MNQNKISDITRRGLLEELSLEALKGRLDLTEFLSRTWPLQEMESTDLRFDNAEGDIWQHMVNNEDWEYEYLFYEYLDVLNCPDSKIKQFIESIVDPNVRKKKDEQSEFVRIINQYLSNDNHELQAVEYKSGYPIFRVVDTQNRVSGNVKNLIFAANGPKPQIVVTDCLNNDIRIVENADNCLVFDRPIPSSGLRWATFLDWWQSATPYTQTKQTADGESLLKRLADSLGSPPEELLFRTYYKDFLPEFSKELPVLVPQVYLHYDPHTVKQLSGKSHLYRQRMDFLILFSTHDRIVIEVDGKQHYSKEDSPSPQKYAEMVAQDRELRLAGYEVYRFGGYELYGQGGKELVNDFFRRLFEKHGVGT